MYLSLSHQVAYLSLSHHRKWWGTSWWWPVISEEMCLPCRNMSFATIILTWERGSLHARRNYRLHTGNASRALVFSAFCLCQLGLFGMFSRRKGLHSLWESAHTFLRYLMDKYYFMIHPANHIVWMWFGFPSCHLFPPLLLLAYLFSPSLLYFCP